MIKTNFLLPMLLVSCCYNLLKASQFMNNTMLTSNSSNPQGRSYSKFPMLTDINEAKSFSYDSSNSEDVPMLQGRSERKISMLTDINEAKSLDNSSNSQDRSEHKVPMLQGRSKRKVPMLQGRSYSKFPMLTDINEAKSLDNSSNSQDRSEHKVPMLQGRSERKISMLTEMPAEDTINAPESIFSISNDLSSIFKKDNLMDFQTWVQEQLNLHTVFRKALNAHAHNIIQYILDGKLLNFNNNPDSIAWCALWNEDVFHKIIQTQNVHKETLSEALNKIHLYFTKVSNDSYQQAERLLLNAGAKKQIAKEELSTMNGTNDTLDKDIKDFVATGWIK